MEEELDYCIHDIDTNSCMWCTGREIDRDNVYSVAVHFGKCDVCRRNIVPGEAIGLIGDTWGCEACIKKQIRAER
jgi:hypothetical protein